MFLIFCTTNNSLRPNEHKKCDLWCVVMRCFIWISGVRLILVDIVDISQHLDESWYFTVVFASDNNPIRSKKILKINQKVNQAILFSSFILSQIWLYWSVHCSHCHPCHRSPNCHHCPLWMLFVLLQLSCGGNNNIYTGSILIGYWLVGWLVVGERGALRA